MKTKKELTPEQQDGINKLAELLRNNPDTADRATEYLSELSGVEAIAKGIDPKRFYKIAEVLKIIGVSRRTVYNIIEAKKLKTVKIGAYQKIIGQDFINFLKKEYDI
jgi:predicted DNA-binding transcriptional regulator AlpA